MRSLALLLCPLAFATACDDEAPPTAPTITGTNLDGIASRVPPSAAIEVHLSSAPDPLDGSEVLIVRGVADARFVSDAEHPPLSTSRQAELEAGRLTVVGATVRFTPEAPLAPSLAHSLVVTTRLRAGGVRLGKSFVRTFTTGPASAGAPVATLASPADGDGDVLLDLREVDVRFSRAVSGVDASSLLLVGPRGPVSAAVAATDCSGCYRLTLAEQLAPDRDYQLVTTPAVLDDDGEPPFVWRTPPRFHTGTTTRTHPPLITDAVATPSSGCLVARWTTDVPASSSLCVDADCVDDDTLVTEHAVARPLAAGGAAEWSIRSRDASTQPAAAVGPAAAPASSPRQLTITEALTHPLGQWPAQQFVEVWNRGAVVERLGGLELRDESGGNVLPDVAIAPGGFALIVPSAWQPDDGVDPIAPSSTVIARVGEAHLGARGLREKGVDLALVESDGRPVSRFSTYGLKLAHGQSASRVAPCDLTTSYAPTPGETSTPGR